MLRVVQGSPFVTLQGEGTLIGMPSTFVRLAGCDLRCHVEGGRYFNCDTPESLRDYDHKEEMWAPVSRDAFLIQPEALAAAVRDKGLPHVVVTGGEPTLQAADLAVFLASLWEWGVNNDERHVTLETNARHFDRAVAEYVDLLSASPKLQAWDQTTREGLWGWLDWCASHGCDAQVKVVVSTLDDAKDALEIFAWASTYYPIEAILQPASPVKDGFYLQLADFCVVTRRDQPATLPDLRLIVQSHKLLGVP